MSDDSNFFGIDRAVCGNQRLAGLKLNNPLTLADAAAIFKRLLDAGPPPPMVNVVSPEHYARLAAYYKKHGL